MFRNAGTADMAHAVLNGTSAPVPSFQRNQPYGAGAVEAADERLAEEIKARRLARAQAKNQQPVMRPTVKGQQHVTRTGAIVKKQAVRAPKTNTQPTLPIDRQLAKARERRKFLEEELKKAVLEEEELEKKKEMMVESEKRKTEFEKRKTEFEKRKTTLEKAKEERDRKRNAAIKRHKETIGAKPTGITKAAPTPPSKTLAQVLKKAAGSSTGTTKSTATLRK